MTSWEPLFWLLIAIVLGCAFGGRLKPELSYDSVHLNDEGYEKWVEALQGAGIP